MSKDDSRVLIRKGGASIDPERDRRGHGRYPAFHFERDPHHSPSGSDFTTDE